MERFVRRLAVEERKGAEAGELLSHLLRERVPEEERAPLAAIVFEALRATAVGGEYAVWEGTVLDGRHRVVVTASLNSAVRIVGDGRPTLPLDDVPGAWEGSLPNVSQPLIRFMSRPTPDMRRLLVESGSLTQVAVQAHLLDTHGRVRPLRMQVLPHHAGGSLALWLRRCRGGAGGKLDWVHTITMLRCVADGLSALRSHGIVHMDMSLDRCMVDLDEGAGPCTWGGAPEGVKSDRLPRVVVTDGGFCRTAERARGAGAGDGRSHEIVAAAIVVECQLEDARSNGQVEAAAVDDRFDWTLSRGPDYGGAPQCRAPEVLSARPRDWNLFRQSAFELGIIIHAVLSGDHPGGDRYGVDTALLPAGEERTRLTPEACGIMVPAGLAGDFAEVAAVAWGLVDAEAASRTPLEEARHVLWWAWGRAVATAAGVALRSNHRDDEPVHSCESSGSGACSYSELCSYTGVLSDSGEGSEGGKRSGEHAEGEHAVGEHAEGPDSSSAAAPAGVAVPAQGRAFRSVPVETLCRALGGDALDDALAAASEVDRQTDDLAYTPMLHAVVANLETVRHAVQGLRGARKAACARLLWVWAANAINATSIAMTGGLGALVGLLRDGDADAVANAARALKAMCSADRHANRASVGALEAVGQLVELVRAGEADVRKHAAGALKVLAVDQMNAARIVDGRGVVPLVHLLRDGDAEAKMEAAGAVQNLAALSAAARASIAGAGAIGPLLRVVRVGSPKAKVNAVSALRNLAVDDAICTSIVGAGAVPPLVALLRDSSNAKCAHAAAGALKILAANEPSAMVVTDAGAVRPLVHWLRHGSADVMAESAGALQNIAAANCATRAAVVKAGAIGPVLDVLRAGNIAGRTAAAGVLRNLSVDDASALFIAFVNAIPALVDLFHSDDEHAKATAAGALQNLALTSAAMRIQIVDAGGRDAIGPVLECKPSQ
jgi:Armadillo/beta-catenin-like repeat